MSRLERIPVFDFQTATPTKSNWNTPAVLVSPSCQTSNVCDGGNADIGVEETSSSTGTSSLPPSLDDFCAVYEVFQCVWFQRKGKLSTNARSKRGPLPTPESKLENEARALKTNENSANRTGCSPKSRTKNAGSIESLVERSSSDSSSPSPSSVLDLLRQTYQSASSKDQDSWNIEDNRSDCDTRERRKDSWSPLDFLGDTVESNDGKTNKPIAANGYCSFVLQDDSDHAVESFARRLEQWLVASAGLGATKELPYSLLVPGTHHTRNQTTDAGSAVVVGNHHNGGAAPRRIFVAPHCWIFVGRNAHTDKRSLLGRKEHTDAVAHDGTVHVQLEGRKVWHLRPTQELIEACDSGYDVALLDSYKVCPDEGDVLVINTRLWWHNTTIPPQQSLSSGHCGVSVSVSVSVARDLYLREPGTRKNSDNHEFDEKFDDESNPRECGSIDGGSSSRSSSRSIGSDSDSGGDRLGRESMSNVDTSWAKGFLPRGTLLLIDRAPIDDRDGHDSDSDAGDDVPPRYYDRVPPSIGRTEHRSRANCRLVVRASEDHDDDNGNDNDNDGDESEIQPRDSDDRALRPTNRNHRQERTDAKRKWIALETIRNIREGEEFVLLSRSESEIEEEDLYVGC
eukprot:CAMPEP_0172390604 /NCGR_PEP_ID=MMETSP1061-20121228/7209_1 /TAXON_ID=37318 /ORGANISM="Pseudo-nitzschia pungens, Strain cf. pungens" /LENGTH=624 /DNA_ID=CAMNT_0013121027 /DNA_START=90 /DNA_END=1964 /DNA_ORIENTATION=+